MDGQGRDKTFVRSMAKGFLPCAIDQRLALAAGPAARDLYRMRKAIVEPVFGQIKDVRGFRRFMSRGVAKVRDEFRFIALTHNLLKLFRSRGRRLAFAG